MKPTPAQFTILHAVLSAAVATIIGAGTAASQYYFNHGQDLWLALVFFGGSLPATFATLRYAVWHAIQTSPQLAQAETDTSNEIKQWLEGRLGQLEARLGSLFNRPVVSAMETISHPAVHPVVSPQGVASIQQQTPYPPMTNMAPGTASAQTTWVPPVPLPQRSSAGG